MLKKETQSNKVASAQKKNVSVVLKKGTKRYKQFLVWLFTGKKLLLSDDVKLICPRCNTKMNKIEKYNVTIDVCPFCEGMWLDNGEINHLNEIANKQIKKVNKSIKSKKSTSKMKVSNKAK